MRIIVSNVLTAEQPTEELRLWCQQNLVLSNPEYAKKVRMGLWVGNTPRTIRLYDMVSGKIVLPYGCLRSLPKSITETTEFVSGFKPVNPISFPGTPVTLYDYQEKAVQYMLKAQFGILQSPAGSGKTQMGIALIRRFGLRALWLTHTLDLLKQSKARAEQFIDKSLIGTISEGKVNIGKGVTFATVQTMNKMDLTLYRDAWDVIIVDECHRIATSASGLTMFRKVLNNLSARHKIGLSATVHRSDGMIAGVYAMIGNIAYIVPEEAVGDKIMKVGIRAVGTSVEIDKECLNPDGTLNYSKLINYLCYNFERNLLIAQEIVSNKDKSCLILSDRLEHLERLIELLPDDCRKKAVMVSGKMTTKKGKQEREKAISDMRSGKKQFLFATYSLAKEGLDIPRLERLFLTTPQKDYAVIVQSIGRIARVYEGKTDPVAYDFVDNIGLLVKSYRKRCAIYKKSHCYFV